VSRCCAFHSLNARCLLFWCGSGVLLFHRLPSVFLRSILRVSVFGDKWASEGLVPFGLLEPWDEFPVVSLISAWSPLPDLKPVIFVLVFEFILCVWWRVDFCFDSCSLWWGRLIPCLIPDRFAHRGAFRSQAQAPPSGFASTTQFLFCGVHHPAPSSPSSKLLLLGPACATISESFSRASGFRVTDSVLPLSLAVVLVACC
jgi:hypothetical protein